MRHSRKYHGPRWVVEYSRHNTLDGRRHTISAKYGLKKQKETHLQVFHSVLATSLLLPSSPCQPLSSIAVRLPSQALRPPLWRVNGVFPQRDRLCFPTHHHHHQPSNPSKTQDIKTKYLEMERWELLGWEGEGYEERETRHTRTGRTLRMASVIFASFFNTCKTSIVS